MSRFAARRNPQPTSLAVAAAVAAASPDPGLAAAFAAAGGEVFYVLRLAPTAGVEFVTATITDLTGWSPGELMESDDPIGLLVPASERAAFARLSGGEPHAAFAAELNLLHRNGGTVPTMHRGRLRTRPDGSLVLEAVARDNAESLRSRGALREAIREHRLLLDNVDEVVITSTAAGVCRYASPSVANVLGWWPQELVGRPVSDLWHPEDRAEAEAVRLTRDLGRGRRLRGRMRRKDGSYLWVESRLRPLTSSGEDGDLEVAVVRDVDELVHTEASLAESRERLRLTMLASPIGIAVLDLDRRFLEVNDSLCRLLGRERPWLLTHALGDLLGAAEAEVDRAARRQLVESGNEQVCVELRLLRSDEQVIWVQHSLAVVRDSRGRPTGFVSQMQDVTASRRDSSELRFLATHDRLTGLLDRHSLEEGLARALAAAGSGRTELALLYCDVRDLTGINATYGRPVGDEVLQRVAHRIASSVRRGDTAFRVGEDEFAVVLEGIRSVGEADQVASHISAATCAPISFGRENLTPGIHLGAVLVDDANSVAEVLARAQRAVAQAKARPSSG